MAKRLKASAKASPPKRQSKKLSLHPLDFATALGAALLAGRMRPLAKTSSKPKTRRSS